LQSLGLTATRSPQGQWTIAAVVEDSQLEAMRAACQWVIYGKEYARQRNRPGLLESAEDVPTPEPHFGVTEELELLPPGWLNVGSRKDMPAAACYKAHCGCTWVWVMPDGVRAFSDFILILHDIATLDASSYSAPLLVTLTREEASKLPADLADPAGKKKLAITVQEQRYVKTKFKKKVEKAIQDGIKEGKVPLTWAQWMEYTAPYHGTRSNVSPAGATAQPSPQEAIPTRVLPVLPSVPVPAPPAPALTPQRTPGAQPLSPRSSDKESD
jgi:hypothetical protein